MAFPVAAAHFQDLRHVPRPPPEGEGKLGQERRQSCDVGMNILQGSLVVKNA